MPSHVCGPKKRALECEDDTENKIQVGRMNEPENTGERSQVLSEKTDFWEVCFCKNDFSEAWIDFSRKEGRISPYPCLSFIEVL